MVVETKLYSLDSIVEVWMHKIVKNQVHFLKPREVILWDQITNTYAQLYKNCKVYSVVKKLIKMTVHKRRTPRIFD